MEKLDEANELYREVQQMKDQMDYASLDARKLEAIDKIIVASKLEPDLVKQMIKEINAH